MTDQRNGNRPEPLLMAKEVQAAFKARNVSMCYDFVRRMMNDCPDTIRGKYVTFNDIFKFWRTWEDNRDGRRRTKKGESSNIAIL